MADQNENSFFSIYLDWMERSRNNVCEMSRIMISTAMMKCSFFIHSKNLSQNVNNVISFLFSLYFSVRI